MVEAQNTHAWCLIGGTVAPANWAESKSVTFALFEAEWELGLLVILACSFLTLPLIGFLFTALPSCVFRTGGTLCLAFVTCCLETRLAVWIVLETNFLAARTWLSLGRTTGNISRSLASTEPSRATLAILVARA